MDRRVGGRVPVDTLAVGDVRSQFSSAVKLLGVYLESDLSLQKQVSSVVKACSPA